MGIVQELEERRNAILEGDAVDPIDAAGDH